jgi:hypothetical protein
LRLLLLQVLIDAVVHAVNEDYDEMAGDFIKLGFLSPGARACRAVMLFFHVKSDKKQWCNMLRRLATSSSWASSHQVSLHAKSTKPPSRMQTCSISSWLAEPLAVLLDVLLDVLDYKHMLANHPELKHVHAILLRFMQVCCLVHTTLC